jgi:hypothetical protein
MKRFSHSRFPWIAALLMTVMAISVSQRFGSRTAHLRALEHWGIRELVDHLNCAGLQVRLRSSMKNGDLTGQYVFLTTTDKDWMELNRLSKDESRIQEWRGIVSCERLVENYNPALYVSGNHYLIVGPFLFIGDAELLRRIRAILALESHVR